MRYIPKAKAFPLHQAAYGYFPDPNLPDQTVRAAIQQGQDSVVQKIAEAGSLLTPHHRTLYHKLPANFNDPIVVFYVLDALVKSRRGLYLRSNEVAYHLAQSHPQYAWDARSVGRVLAGLERVCFQTYAVEPLQPFFDEDVSEETRKKCIPFATGRDGVGRYYVIDPQNGNEGLLWLLFGRKRFYDLAVQSMEDDNIGRSGANWGTEWSPSEYIGSVMPDAIRTPQGWRDQLKPNTVFEQISEEIQVGPEPSFRGA